MHSTSSRYIPVTGATSSSCSGWQLTTTGRKLPEQTLIVYVHACMIMSNA